MQFLNRKIFFTKYILSFFSCLVVILPSVSGEQVPDVTLVADSDDTVSKYASRPPISIDKNVLEARGAHNISEVLQNDSDIQLQQLYEGSPIVPSMRGFGDNASSNVLILLNGMPISYADMGGVTLDILPLNEIQRIDVLPGSAGVLYGDQAVGGVINILTSQYTDTNYQTSLNLGSYEALKYTFGITHPIKNDLNAHIDGQYYRTDNYRFHNQLTDGNINLGLNNQYENGFWQIDYRYYLNNLQYPGALTAEQVAEDRRQAQNDIDFENQQHHDFFAKWRHVFNENYSLDQNIFIQVMHGHGVLTNPFNEQRDLIETNPVLSGVFNIKNKSINYQTGVALQYADYRLNELSFLDNSAQYKEDLFSEFSMMLNRVINFTFGVRGAQAQNNLNLSAFQRAINSAIVSDLGFTWNLKHHLKLYLRRAGNYRFPKAEENALSLDAKPLRTQQGVSYETGLIWQYDDKKLSVDLYQLNLTNEIMFIPTISGLLGTNQNLPPTTRLGGSFKSFFPLSSKLKLGINYSYVDAKFSEGPNAGKFIPFVAAHKASFNVHYYFFERWYLRLETILLSNQYPDGDVTNQGNVLTGYGVINVALRYKFKYFSAVVTVNNLTNLKYNNFAQVNQLGSMMRTGYYPAPTRNFWLNLIFDM